MSSKSSRHSGVRIQRDKLENAIISSFSKPYLMGSDLNPRVSGQNLEEKYKRKSLEMKDVVEILKRLRSPDSTR